MSADTQRTASAPDGLTILPLNPPRQQPRSGSANHKIGTAVLGLLLAGGVGIAVNHSGPSATSATPGTAADTPSSVNHEFLSAARDGYATFADMDDADLLKIGMAVCQGYDEGLGFTSIGTAGVRAGLTAEETGHIIGISVARLCPEHASTLAVELQ